MAWRRRGDKPLSEPLSEPMMVSLLTHICVTRPQLILDKGHANEILAVLEQLQVNNSLQ